MGWALFGKIAAGFAAFLILFGRGDKEETNIAIEGMKEFTYQDGNGSTVVSTLNPRQGLVVFKNDGTSLVHYALVSIDGEWVGEDRIKNANQATKWRLLLFNPGERKLNRIHKLQASEGDEGGDFGSHHIEAYIFVKDRNKARFVRKIEYELSISDTYRNAPEGSGMYWILEIHPTYITEGSW